MIIYKNNLNQLKNLNNFKSCTLQQFCNDDQKKMISQSGGSKQSMSTMSPTSPKLPKIFREKPHNRLETIQTPSPIKIISIQSIGTGLSPLGKRIVLAPLKQKKIYEDTNELTLDPKNNKSYRHKHTLRRNQSVPMVDLLNQTPKSADSDSSFHIWNEDELEDKVGKAALWSLTREQQFLLWYKYRYEQFPQSEINLNLSNNMVKRTLKKFRHIKHRMRLINEIDRFSENPIYSQDFRNANDKILQTQRDSIKFDGL